MPFKSVPKEIKDQILERIKSGVPVSQLSVEHGVARNTIYSWISQTTTSSPGLLNTSRWKNEKRDLLLVIGALSFELSKIKKNRVSKSYG